MRHYEIKVENPFDYVDSAGPTNNVNPVTHPVTWLNLTSGEIFVCINNTPDSNIWVGQLGSAVL